MATHQNSESRSLPILKIHDTDFAVDLIGLEFIQVDNVTNRISFKDVQDNGDHTSIVYDPQTKNVFRGTWHEMREREDVKIIKLPAAINLDTQTLADEITRNARIKYSQSQQEKQVVGKASETTRPARQRRKGRGI